MSSDLPQLISSGVVAALKCLAVVILLLIARGVCWLVSMFFIAPRSDPLRHLPGPEAKRMESHFFKVLKLVAHLTPIATRMLTFFLLAPMSAPTLTATGCLGLVRPSGSTALEL